METNEIMAVEEVMDVTEDISAIGFGKGYKMAVGIGLAVLVSGITYKYVAKPIMTKIKAKKNQRDIVVAAEDTDDGTDSEDDESIG